MGISNSNNLTSNSKELNIKNKFIYDMILILIPLIFTLSISFSIIFSIPNEITIGASSIMNILLIIYVLFINPPINRKF